MSGEEHSTQSSHGQGATIVFFITFGMLIGALCRVLNRKTKFPYTPMLLIVGLLLGHFRHIFGIVGTGTEILSNLNPHMILFIFIPILIFESGFNCDWYAFKKALLNIVLLAAPGVLWGALLIAVCFKTILGYGDDQLTWNQALTLGCVLSATDPVAVVALLKQLGASLRFNTLIEGESLLNDGTAMVFFLLFLDMVKGYTSTPGQVLLNFVRIGLGGPLLGIVVGLISTYFLKKVIRDDVLTANITFLACYFCFWFAEFTWLKVSGILSLVVLGLFLSASAKTKIYPESQHSLHAIWSYIQYVSQTTIFLLTGIIIGVKLMSQSTITFNDWIKMFAFYILMNICRLVMCGTLLPILRCNGYGVSSKEFTVLVYGGLRGALGLCLALLVTVDLDLSLRFREITLFYMGSMATLTLLINGTTCGSLVNYVDMIDKPPIKQKLFKRCLDEIQQHTHQKIEDLKTDRFLQLADWKKVQSSLKNDGQVKQLEKTIAQKNQRNSQRFSSLLLKFKSVEIQTELRHKAVKVVQNAVWERFQDGLCEENAARILNDVCNVNLDFSDKPLNFWQNITPTFTSFGNLTLWMYAQSFPLFVDKAQEYLLIQIHSVYDLACNLIICLEETKEVMQDLPIDEQFIKIDDEMSAQIHKAQSYLIDLQTQFPHIISIIQMKKAVATVLKHRKHLYKQYTEDGLIDDKQLKQVLLEVDEKMYSLDELKLGRPNFSSFNLEYPLFAHLTSQQIKHVLNVSYIRTVEKGCKIYEVGEEVKEVYLIVSGGVADTVRNKTIVRGMGALLSPANILSINGRSYSSATATCAVQVRAIPIELILKLMENPMFRFKVFCCSLPYFVKLHKQRAGRLAYMEQNKLNQYIRRSTMVHVANEHKVQLINGGYVFEGALQAYNLEKEQVFESYSYLPPGIYINIVSKPVTILKLQSKREQVLEERASIFDHGRRHKKSLPMKKVTREQLYQINIAQIKQEKNQNEKWREYSREQIQYILYWYHNESTKGQDQRQ